MTYTVSARNTASRRSWVTSITVTLRSACRSRSDAPQLLAGERVERSERLVEQQDLRLVDERAADRGALLHAAGELPRKLVRESRETDFFEQAPRALAIGAPLRADAAAVRLDDLQRQEHVLERVAPRQEIRVLERHAHALQRPAHFPSLDREPAGGDRREPADQLHQRGLAAAGRPHHRDELALRDREIDAVDGLHGLRAAAVVHADGRRA